MALNKHMHNKTANLISWKFGGKSDTSCIVFMLTNVPYLDQAASSFLVLGS